MDSIERGDWHHGCAKASELAEHAGYLADRLYAEHTRNGLPQARPKFVVAAIGLFARDHRAGRVLYPVQNAVRRGR
jgi:hypothetical protein